jgi:hypothetical protein
MIAHIKEKFLERCRQKIQKAPEEMISYNPLGKYWHIRDIISIFFSSGYGLLLKILYPDNKIRKHLRQQYIQTICEEIIQETASRMRYSETFCKEDYFIFQSTQDLYKRYWGTKEIITNHEIFDKNLNKHIQQNISKERGKVLQETNLIIKEQKKAKKENIYDLYSKINTYYLSIGHQYLITSTYKEKDSVEQRLKKERSTIDVKWTPFLENNKKYWQNKYPEEIVYLLSHWGYEISHLEKIIDAEDFAVFLDLCKQTLILKKEIIKVMIQARTIKNTSKWGKIQRIIEEQIIKNFWIINNSQEQQQFLWEYLLQNLYNIIIQDINEIDDPNRKLRKGDESFIQECIKEYILNTKQRTLIDTPEKKRLE